jgi:hypothetical protein
LALPDVAAESSAAAAVRWPTCPFVIGGAGGTASVIRRARPHGVSADDAHTPRPFRFAAGGPDRAVAATGTGSDTAGSSASVSLDVEPGGEGTSA